MSQEKYAMANYPWKTGTHENTKLVLLVCRAEAAEAIVTSIMVTEGS